MGGLLLFVAAIVGKWYMLESYGRLKIFFEELLENCSPQTDPYATQLIQSIKMPKKLISANLVSMVLTMEDLIKEWKKVQEHTSFRPSGYQFRFAKVVCEVN